MSKADLERARQLLPKLEAELATLARGEERDLENISTLASSLRDNVFN